MTTRLLKRLAFSESFSNPAGVSRREFAFRLSRHLNARPSSDSGAVAGLGDFAGFGVYLAHCRGGELVGRRGDNSCGGGELQ